MTLLTRAPLLLLATLALTACSSSTGTPSPSPTRDAIEDESFCALVEEGQGYSSDVEATALMESMYAAISDATTDDDPTAIAAIKAWGASLVVAIDESLPVYEELLSITDDAMLRRAIELTLELNRDIGGSFADSFASVTSISEYTSLMNSISEETNAALSDPDDQEALLYYNEYLLDNCGISIE